MVVGVRHKNLCIEILVLCVLIVYPTHALNILYPPEYVSYFVSPSLVYGARNFNLTANVTIPDPTSACEPLKNAQVVSGTIVFLLSFSGCSFEHQARMVQQAGAVGALFQATTSPHVAGRGIGWTDGTDTSDITIPVVEAGMDNQTTYQAMLGGTIVFTVSIATEDNPWADMYASGGMVFFKVYLCLYSGLLMLFAVYRGWQFTSVIGFRPRISTVIIALEIFANLERLLYIAIDPIGSTHTFPRPAATILQYITLCTALIIEVLVLLVWMDATGTMTSRKKSDFLTRPRSKIIFGVFTTCIVILNITEQAIQGAYLDTNALNYIVGICYLVIQFGIAGFFFYAGIRVLNALSNPLATSASKPTAMLMRLLFVMGATTVVVEVAGIIAVTDIDNHPWGDYALWLIIFTCLNTFSAAQLTSFTPPQKPSASSQLSAATSTNLAVSATTESGSATMASNASSSE